MTTQAKRLKSIGGRRRLVLSILAAAVALPAAADDMEQMHASHVNTAPARFVELVRLATQQFLDVNAATASGCQPFLGCVTGPDHDAMGIHFVNGALVGDGEIDASHPEALIYEPANGVMRACGRRVHRGCGSLDGRAHQSAGAGGPDFPTRRQPKPIWLGAVLELHVWAWRDNPNGAFVDWNTRVTCEGP